MPSLRIVDFDTWRPGYGLASVRVEQAGTATLATIYSDEDLTVPVSNPVTLTERIVGGVSYGKFSAPIYVGVAYELVIDSIEQTGISRIPLTTLAGQDASMATVLVTGGTEDIELEDHLARRIDARDYGEFIAVGAPGASTTTNTETLVAALGVAGGAGGGYVEVPAGTYQVTDFTVPTGVIIRGAGRVATTLQSTVAGEVATIGGARAGFSRLTLDGVTLVANSIGVLAVNKSEIVFDDVEIKRFETGIHCKGGERSAWHELYISNCVNGCKQHGDAASTQGAAWRFNQWHGGKIELCTTVGLELKNVDLACEHNAYSGLIFDTNTGTAVKVTGARMNSLRDCEWTGNTANLDVNDATPVTTTNTIIGLDIAGGSIDGGTITLTNNLESVAFRRMTLSDVTATLTTATHNVLIEDCNETNVAIAGTTPTAWARHKTTDRGATAGLTTSNVATKAWSIALEPGQLVYLEAKVIGRQRNGINTGFYHFAASAARPGATLGYDTQTGNFTLGNTLTGGTSGATARITGDTDAGTTGSLTLQDIVGAFVGDEIITDGATGSATVNGGLSTSNATIPGGRTDLRPPQETDATWGATFVVSSNEIELRVTGGVSQTVEWTCDVDVVSN